MRVRVGLASFGVGCMAFFLGVLPYVAVGKVPVLTGFESRHQLLVPFGAAVMLVSAVRLALGRFRHGEWMGLAVILVFVAGSISADIGSTLSYYREMYKTDSFLLHVREQPEFKSGTAFMIDDRTPELNVSGRGPMRFYEYSGMFASVFDEETRFGADEAGWRAFEELERASRARGASYLSRQYKLGGYVVRKPQYVVTITRGSLNVSRNDTVIRLAWLQLTNHAAFEQVVERAVDVRVSPYPAP